MCCWFIGPEGLLWTVVNFELAVLFYHRTTCAGVPVTVSTQTAVVGHHVQLPCDLSQVEKDVSLMLWYKELSPFAIYTVDARSSSLLQKAPHKIHPDYERRAYYNVTAQGSFLHIDPVVESDAGKYKCVIEYRRSRTKEHEVILNVIVPPKETIIMDEHGQRLQGLIGPYNEGQSLALVCEADGGYPLPAVTWWKGGSLLDDTYTKTPQGFSRNELLLPVLVRQDFLVVLSCQARNTFAEPPVISSIQLDLNLKPLSVEIISPDQPFSAGREVQVECRITGGRPSAHVTWWISGRQLTDVNDVFSEKENLTISVLRFVAGIEDNERELSCRAENPQIYDSDIEDTRIIRVHYAPQVTVVLDGGFVQGQPAAEGDEILLRCFVKANPSASSIRWLFRDTLIDGRNSDENVVIKNDLLHISKINKKHHGVYKCRASNSEGDGTSRGILVEVQYIPECLHKRKTAYVVSKYETIRVTCEIDAFPTDVTFHWTMVKTQEAVVVSPSVVNGTVSVVSLTPRSDEDYGTLNCVTRNSVGEQLKPCVFEILPAGPPEPVRNCSLLNRTSDSLVIGCEPGADRGYLQHFYLELFNTRLEKLQANASSTKAPLFTLHELPSGSSFIVFMYAMNANGKSKAVSIRVETLEDGEESKDFHGISILTPALMGLVSTVAVLVLCAVLIVAAMKIRPRYNHPPKEEIVVDKKVNANKYSWKDGIVPVSPGPGPDVVPEENFCKGNSTKSAAKSLTYIPDGHMPECLFQEIPLDALPPNHLVKAMRAVERRKDCEEEESGISVETPLMDKISGPFSIYKSPLKEARDPSEEWCRNYIGEERPEQY